MTHTAVHIIWQTDVGWGRSCCSSHVGRKGTLSFFLTYSLLEPDLSPGVSVRRSRFHLLLVFSRFKEQVNWVKGFGHELQPLIPGFK